MTTLTYTKDVLELNNIHKRVEKCYKRLKQSSVKFTEDMITLIKLDFISHYDCKLSEINSIKDLSPVTQRYLQECNKKLKNYNPINVKQNLKEMNLF